MTTITLPAPRRSTPQRWLPYTLVAACLSVLFISALMLRPNPNENFLNGLIQQSSATPTAAASPTFVPTTTWTPTPLPAVIASPFAPTVVPPVSSSGVGCESPQAAIFSPSNGMLVGGVVEITGIADSPNFGLYRLEMIGVGTGSQYVTLVAGTAPVTNAGKLAEVDLSAYSPDNYGLRLTVFDSANQLLAACLVNFTLTRVVYIAAQAGTVAATNIGTVPLNAVVTTDTFARTSPSANGNISMTLPAGTVVQVADQSSDQLWVHIWLNGGKNGWVLKSELQSQPPPALAVPEPVIQAIVKVEQTTLHEQPDATSRIIRTVGHNSTFVITEKSADGQWLHIVLPDNTEGWLLGDTVQTDGVPQIQRPAIMCGAKVGAQGAAVYSRPNLQGNAVTIGSLMPDTQVVILDVDNQSGNPEAWYFVKAFEDQAIQGWVGGNALFDINYCSQPSSPRDQFTVVMPTIVPPAEITVPTLPPSAGVADPMQATILPPTATPIPPDVASAPVIAGTPTAYYDSVMRTNPPSLILRQDFAGIPANTEVQLASAQYDGHEWVYQIVSPTGMSVSISQSNLIRITSGAGTSAAVAIGICHVMNTNSDSIGVYSSPSSDASQSVLVNNLAPNVMATVFYQQREANAGPVWYLVIAVMAEGKQVSGWVSSDLVTPLDMCPPAY